MENDPNRSSIEELRAQLALEHPVRIRSGAMRAITERAEEHVSLFPEVMRSLGATRRTVWTFGDDARELGVALHAAERLVRSGATMAPEHVRELQVIASTRDPSLPNQRDAAQRILGHAGIAIVEPAPAKPVKPVREAPLERIRKALAEDAPDRVVFLLRKVKKKDVDRDDAPRTDAMLADVQRAVARERELSCDGTVHSHLGDWLGFAKLLLPSPAADRALYASMSAHPIAQVKTRARACLRLIDAASPSDRARA